jgi:hypothetical protein
VRPFCDGVYQLAGSLFKPRKTKLEAATDALVDELRAFSPIAQRTAKKLLNDTENSTLAIAIELEGHCYSRLRQSDDFREGVACCVGPSASTSCPLSPVSGGTGSLTQRKISGLKTCSDQSAGSTSSIATDTDSSPWFSVVITARISRLGFTPQLVSLTCGTGD